MKLSESQKRHLSEIKFAEANGIEEVYMEVGSAKPFDTNTIKSLIRKGLITGYRGGLDGRCWYCKSVKEVK